MASSPENSPSGKADSTNSSPPASNSTKSGSPPSPPQSPPPSNAPSPSAQKSPPPSPPPGSPPPKSSPPPSSPPPSSPPPSSPSPSSPPPSSPSQSSPPPPTPSGSKTSPSPPPSSGAASPPPSTPNATPTPPSTSNGTPTPPSTSNGTPTPPSTSKGTPTTPDIFSPPPALNAPSTPGGPNQGAHLQSSSGGSSDNTEIIAGAATGGALVLAVVVVALLCILRKRKKTFYIDPATRGGGSEGVGEHVVKLPPPSGVRVSPHSGWGPLQSSPPHSSGNSPGFSDPHQMPISPLNLGKSQFTYDELATATGGFSQAYILGQGGFGMVYKGVLPYGQQVAVKTLKSGSGQGEREFQAEVEIISRVHHRHLVSLVGYCMFKEQRMLVYEFVPNSTLEFHLHGKGQPVMDWKTRFRIAIGSAKGLAYLHEDCHPKIIHRDIKSANILLDNNFEAMVADFGLAKFTSDNISHVSTRVMGTFGYMAPEYASTGKLTDKSDVFSFGVMLLELITGKRPIDPTNNLIEDSLVDWARPLMSKALESGYFAELVDPRLEGYYDPQEMARMVSVASSSIRHSARLRLKMSQIVRTLEGDLDEERLKPGQSIGETEIYDTIAYNADMLKFKNMVMNNSQEYPSSEFRDATSEYDRLTTNSDRDYHSGNLHRV